MIKNKIYKTFSSFSQNDLIYFFYSILFYEIFFKLTRRYYYVFEDTLNYYFSFFGNTLFYSPYSLITLGLLITIFSIIFNKLFLINYAYTNILSFLFIFYALKINDFPRTNFLYSLILFPVLYFVLSKINISNILKIAILLVPLFVSINYQSYYFNARQVSYESNIAAQDYSFIETNIYQNKEEIYNKLDTINAFRDISFNNELFIKEFILCCENFKFSKTSGKPIGYITQYNENLLYISATGELFYMNLQNLFNESKSNFQEINTNFREIVKNEMLYGTDERFSWGGWESVRNIFQDNGFIYVSYIDEVDNDCTTLSILKAEANLNGIEFKKFFSLDECIDRLSEGYTAAQSGGAIDNYDDQHLIITVGDFRQRHLVQNLNSQYGKTLKINKNDATSEILSFGHRNPQGINKVGEDLFIATEHGPRMGDEINLIDTSSQQNFGWPISSYGLDYNSLWGINYVFEETDSVRRYEKSHSEFGFVEPIYYFGVDKVVEHGISDIAIINSDENNIEFFFGSLKHNRLYKASYNITDSSFNYLDSYNLKNRIRDLLKINNNFYIALLENPARVAIVSLNKE